MTFVLAATAHGPMIVDTNDWAETPEGRYGVSHQLLTRGVYDKEEVSYTKELLSLLHMYRGDGVVAIDGGANLGVFTIEWARHMQGWGRVLAFEVQERIYRALCGNIILNNLDNVNTSLCALSNRNIELCVPRLDNSCPASFGSVSLVEDLPNDTGQETTEDTTFNVVDAKTLDKLFPCGRVDFLKLDIEGMELQVLRTATELLQRERPVILVEWLKTDRMQLSDFLFTQGYTFFEFPRNWICVPQEDNIVDHVRDWRIG